ncbi:hypothetical protein PFICI_07556 [Pestalotiopsis fici W106-1]|uniref:Uncharacterized protein n=1 Tax=Pestalotiopsis fici (strain W106-1 / CGMCC3.15140) TaxID=1229662 RepID=W3X3N5_PESFW|nr:uncharacterized protein PFICI_07556 [Pestalotiopsis fici W106-1]ETS80027.1 hypothetical protein PFICI_07556 [Pestalotiopsis fici W106-1]
MAEAGEPILGSLYVYAPNKGAPIFFAIAYALSTGFHIWQCIRYKAFKLVGLHSICALLFTLGYALRAYGAFNNNYLYSETDQTPLIMFILSQVFIFICPPLLELANYHILGRTFYYVPYIAPLPPGRVLATFGGLMAVVETLNALGVALSANAASTETVQTLGANMTVAALSIQFFVILTFYCMAGMFHWRCIKAGLHTTAIRTILDTLYASMFLILARCIYRMVEHTTGSTNIDLDNIEVLQRLSPVLRYEVFFYIFEATFMLFNSILWNIWHPGRFLPREHHIYLAQDGSEVQGQEDMDDRPLIVKTANVLTFGLLFRRKRNVLQIPETQELGDMQSANRA